MAKLSGSCLCGSVEYSASGEPVLTAFCHCRNCQKGGGGGYSANVAVPAGSLAILGPVERYSWTGGSGSEITRSFCPKCGSPIVIKADALDGLALIQAGTLDDPAAIEPNVHIWCASAQPWDNIAEGATCLPGGPPASN
jgi:hypothetical protein